MSFFANFILLLSDKTIINILYILAYIVQQ